MDILDKPGDHAVIFDKWGTLNGVSGAYTYEATTDQTYGGIQGTKRYFISMKTIDSGYIPARYKYLASETSSQPTTNTTTTTTTTDTTTTAPATTTGTTTTSTATPSTATTPKFKVGGYAQVSNVTSYANLRANIGTSYAILTTVPKGTILNLTDFSNGWYKVTYNGQTGWISEITLGTVPANQYVTVNGVYQLNIRMTPSSTAQIVGTLVEGQYAQKLSQTSDGGWYKISINGIQGWSYSKYLTYIQ
jgi:SH3-like domain-containing protein